MSSLETTEPSTQLPQARVESPYRRALPFVLALGLIGFTLYRLDLRAFLRNLAQVNHLGYLAFATAFIFGLLIADSYATVLVYRGSLPKLRFHEFFVVRAASYLPSLLNHHVGQAFLTVHLARKHGVPIAQMAGSTLVAYASWGGAILGLGCVALVGTNQSFAWLVPPIGAGLLYLLVLALKPARLAKRALLAPLFDAGVRGHLLALIARLPHVVVLFLGTWLSFSFFGVHIPASFALAYVPILMVAVTLPITPQGVGTRDVLAATFFERFAEGATSAERLAKIAAATTTSVVATTLIELALGAFFLRYVMKKASAH